MPSILYKTLLLLLLAGQTLAPAPEAGAAAPAPPRPIILVSIPPQKYLLERLAGDSVEIVTLVGAGADPHSYEPGPARMRAAAKASAWFTLGLPFEDIWGPRLSARPPGPALISCLQGLDLFPEEGRAKETRPDPHVWLSPLRARQIALNMAAALEELWPERRASFQAEASRLAAELEVLHTEIAQLFQTVPPERRVFLSVHPSWTYFARDYQLNGLYIEDEGREPGPRHLSRIINAARARGLTVLFVEPQFPKKTAERLASIIGADLESADPLAENLPALYRGMTEKLLRSFQRQKLPAQ
jgi:zinc transport system substrate-binding protein